MQTKLKLKPRQRGATLVEVMMSFAVAGIGLSGIVGGYLLAARRAEWSSCAAAAQGVALERLEQTRAAKWDPNAFPPVDELVPSNFPVLVRPLDIPLAQSGSISSVTTTTISEVSASPPVRRVHIECVWSLPTRGPFTNSLLSYRSPDQ